jgi:glycosyltransferase involved in cell wall biosynthesis
MALIKNKAPQATLHIYGNGPWLGRLESLINELELKKNVLLRKVIPLREIAEVVTQADLGVIPKRNDQFGGEAFSTKALEFMSCGIPIVVSRTKIDQYYFNDSIVRFFEPESIDDLASAMLTMIYDAELRKTQSAKAFDFVRHNNWGVKKQIYLNRVDKECGEPYRKKTMMNPYIKPN